MTDAQLLERLDKAVFVPAQPEDLTPFPLEEMELMSTDQVAALSIALCDLEPHAGT